MTRVGYRKIPAHTVIHAGKRPTRPNASTRRRERFDAAEGELLAPRDELLATTPERVRKLFAEGVRMFRGEKPHTSRLGFATDPGHYGRGVYWTTDPDLAWYYAAYEEDRIRTSVVRLRNPLVLTEREAVAFQREHGTGHENEDMRDRVDAAGAVSKWLRRDGYDGVLVIHRGSVEAMVLGDER